MGTARLARHFSTPVEHAGEGLDPESRRVYVMALDTLRRAEIEFLLGGAHALAPYTGVLRDTKDLDVFLRQRDCERALAALDAAGFVTELTFPHWLAKAYMGERFIDLIFSSGNAVAQVDDLWFYARGTRARARRAGPPVPSRGDDLVQGVHHGARAIRRRRCRAPDSRVRTGARLAPPAGTVRAAVESPPEPSDPLRVHLPERARGHPRRGDGFPPGTAPTRADVARYGRPGVRRDVAVAAAVPARRHRARVCATAVWSPAEK